MKTILFVCTGNTFRSMCAELFLKKHLKNKNITVSSAGIVAKKAPLHKVVKEELEKLGFDTTKHKQRKVTKKILEKADIIISMSTEHKKFLKEKFNTKSILFNEICHGKKEPFLDYPDIIKETHSRKKAEEYLIKAIPEIEKSIKILIKKQKW